ncbi:hypothetical protein KCH_48650 [Kitasatospora cheerisanensis KCTC 2395]|uniref:Uncharacterized protein n=1 Tax=Kitasatospora cheerisanensis KCTC 2395 TaxID=1348663 RepID=A0A066YPA7_9ACTN|nr:hypothetical protein KCH_48650 [Kitasatospora cheerisanensis KCTC 2395]
MLGNQQDSGVAAGHVETQTRHEDARGHGEGGHRVGHFGDRLRRH